MALLEIEDQTAFNIERWEQVCQDEAIAAVNFRVETNRFGETIMTPPPSFDHGRSQHSIGREIEQRMTGGTIASECPISTSEGVRLADTAWISDERLVKSENGSLLTVAPEICVEVISPSNSRQEIEAKIALHFEAGAEEVWTRDLDGTMRFYLKAAPECAAKSQLCPDFPDSI